MKKREKKTNLYTNFKSKRVLTTKNQNVYKSFFVNKIDKTRYLTRNNSQRYYYYSGVAITLNNQFTYFLDIQLEFRD